jgi:hypothetical protein
MFTISKKDNKEITFRIRGSQHKGIITGLDEGWDSTYHMDLHILSPRTDFRL